MKRKLGPAWLEADGSGGWSPRRGRAKDGAVSEREAIVQMAAVIDDHITGAEQERADAARREADAKLVTFGMVARDWLDWLGSVKGARPSTLRDYRSLLAEPGVAHRRGQGSTRGRIMAAFGGRPAVSITTRDVSKFLRDLDSEAVSARTVNKHRQVLLAIFNYGRRADTFDLPANPVEGTDKRRELPPAALDYFEPDEIDKLAQAAADGAHRGEASGELGSDEIAARAMEDAQDAELYRVLAFTGMRLGEARALRWGDVDLGDRRLIVQRAVSADEEGPTKAWQVRYLPLADPAHDALVRLQARGDFTSTDDYVFCSRLGARLDPSAIRKRYHAARKAAGLRHVKLHGLRHTAGSLAARELDAPSVQAFLGHSKLTTTMRYLHGKARPDDVERLNRAFEASANRTGVGTD